MADERIGIQNTTESVAQTTRERHLFEAASERLRRGPLVPLIVLVAAGLVYGSIFCHVESIPTAVGANLVPAERILKGEVPYRDFYKIQTPGIMFINAALFKLFGASLFTAMSAVFVFKVLTVAMVFICTRSVSDWKLGLMASLFALVWVAPGGPFRSAPIQFEMLFGVSAIWFTLRWLSDGKLLNIFLAGLAVGMVAVFKQNVGVYYAVALAGSVILNGQRFPSSMKDATRLCRESLTGERRTLAVAAMGLATPLGLMAIYLVVQGALGAAIRIFLMGPGEHLRARFTGYPIPKLAMFFIAGMSLALLLTRWLINRYPRLRKAFIAAATVFSAWIATQVSEDLVDNFIYWFAPSLFAFAIWKYYRSTRTAYTEWSEGERGTLLTLLLFSMAAYGEVFPRSVRGLLIETMPPAFILLAFLCGRRQSAAGEGWIEESGLRESWPPQRRIAVGMVSVVLLVFATRTAGPGYFEVGGSRMIGLKADTELNFDRGRGIYFPANRARRINDVVALVRSKVEPGGYMFAHSLDSSSYYFLADRNSPTAATLWNDTGTDDAERARIIDVLREKRVRLVLTSRNALASERYGPLIEMLRNEFHEVDKIGQVVFLEREYQPTSH